MTEQQARFVRKLHRDQACSPAMVARKFFEEYGPTTLCKDPSGIIYFDIDAKESKFHRVTEGKIPCKNYTIIDRVFEDVDGQRLIDKTDNVLGEPIDVLLDDLEFSKSN